MNLQPRSKFAPTLPIVSALFAGAVIGLATKSLLDARKRRRSTRALSRLTTATPIATDSFISSSMNDAPFASVSSMPPVASLVPAVTAEPIDPEQLLLEVRQSFNGIVTDPQAVDVSCAEGRILLKGSIFRDEVQPLLDSIQAVPGVNGVENQLTEIDNIDTSAPATSAFTLPVHPTESSGFVDLAEASDTSEFTEETRESTMATDTSDVPPKTDATDFAAVSEANAALEDEEAPLPVDPLMMTGIVPPVVTALPPTMELFKDEDDFEQQNQA